MTALSESVEKKALRDPAGCVDPRRRGKLYLKSEISNFSFLVR